MRFFFEISDIWLKWRFRVVWREKEGSKRDIGWFFKFLVGFVDCGVVLDYCGRVLGF